MILCNGEIGRSGKLCSIGSRVSRCHIHLILLPVFFCTLFFSADFAIGSDNSLVLQDLITEALKNNREIITAEARIRASEFKIPQVTSLPDPMFMFGYQNEGFDSYTYGKSGDAKWMFSASQMLPFPGKLRLKGDMAKGDAEAMKASLHELRVKTIVRISELYYDLLLEHKTIGLLREKSDLFARIEDAALARYASGMGMQQDVLMAQTEKYMLLEREEMRRQRIQSLEAMLNSSLGRYAGQPLGIPAAHDATPYDRSMEEVLSMAYENSPELKTKGRMIDVEDTKVQMAEREYYPDFTVTAGYEKRGGDFMDMWSLTTAFNIPIFYKTRQRQAVNEAKASLEAAKQELEAVRFMMSAVIRDNYSMMKTAGKLMDLYKEGLVRKTYQDFESSIAAYTSGKTEAMTVISRLKALLDYEMLYWVQYVEREKAIARLQALSAVRETDMGGAPQ